MKYHLIIEGELSDKGYGGYLYLLHYLKSGEGMAIGHLL